MNELECTRMAGAVWPEITDIAPGVKHRQVQITSVLGRSELNFPSQRREVSMILFLHHRLDIAIQTLALHHPSFTLSISSISLYSSLVVCLCTRSR